jgi:hypothetical protein
MIPMVPTVFERTAAASRYGYGPNPFTLRMEARRDEAPTVTGCLWCPGWQHVGSAAEGRVLAREHRELAHPEAKSRKRRRRR